MGGIVDLLRAATLLAGVAGAGVLLACGGSDGVVGAASESQPLVDEQPALQGVRVSGRDDALQLAARAVLAPLHIGELAHAVLARAFEVRAITHSAEPAVSAGDGWMLALHAKPLAAGTVLDGPVAITIESADQAEGVLLRGEAGSVRALMRFDRVTLGASAHIDGEIVVEVSRSAEAAGPDRRSRADALSVTDGERTLRWSYLDVKIDAQQTLQTLTVVSDVPVDGAGNVWLDVTTGGPDKAAAHYVASGVIGFLQARLRLQPAADGGWTIAVDNDKDDRTDFIVQASAHDLGALIPGR